MGVKTGRDDHQLRCKFPQLRENLGLIGGPHFGAGAFRRQRDVDDLTVFASFIAIARARPKRHLLAGDNQGALFIPQQILSAIAVMHIEINNRNAG